MGKAMRRINKAVARALRPTSNVSKEPDLQIQSEDEAARAIEQSKWSMSSAAVTIRPPRLPASVDFGPAVPDTSL